MGWQDDPVVSGWQSDPVVSSYEQTAKADSNTQNLLASAGGALAGIPLGVRSLFGQAKPGEVEDWKQSMAGLWSTPMGKVGTVAGGVAAALPAMLIPGANTALGAGAIGAAYGGIQPVGEGDSRLANAALGAGGGVVGKYAGDLLGKGAAAFSASRGAKLDAAKAANATRDATIREAQSAGYVFPPNQVRQDGGLVNGILEGVSGKIKTAQTAAVRNQAVTNRLAAQELGLPADSPLSKEALGKVREAAGVAYKQLKGVGQVQADDAFRNDLGTLVGEYRTLATEFPSQKNAAIDTLIADIEKPQFNSSSLVELVKRLRHDGFKNVNSPDPVTSQLGRVQLGAQEALENMAERHLATTGNSDLLQAYRSARTLIAKTYSVEKALEDSTGNVVASKIGRQFSNGKPLSGGLETIGKTAEAFPRTLQNMNTSNPAITAVDAMTGAVAGSASGNPLLAALPLARHPIRSAILSKPYQRAMVSPSNYEGGLLGRSLPAIAQSESTKQLLRLLGISAPVSPREQ